MWIHTRINTDTSMYVRTQLCTNTYANILYMHKIHTFVYINTYVHACLYRMAAEVQVSVLTYSVL